MKLFQSTIENAISFLNENKEMNVIIDGIEFRNQRAQHELRKFKNQQDFIMVSNMDYTIYDVTEIIIETF